MKKKPKTAAWLKMPVGTEKELRRLRAENRRLNDICGTLWVFRCDPERPALLAFESWAVLEEQHDKHRNAVARGR